MLFLCTTPVATITITDSHICTTWCLRVSRLNEVDRFSKRIKSLKIFLSCPQSPCYTRFVPAGLSMSNLINYLFVSSRRSTKRFSATRTRPFFFSPRLTSLPPGDSLKYDRGAPSGRHGQHRHRVRLMKRDLSGWFLVDFRVKSSHQSGSVVRVENRTTSRLCAYVWMSMWLSIEVVPTAWPVGRFTPQYTSVWVVLQEWEGNVVLYVAKLGLLPPLAPQRITQGY